MKTDFNLGETIASQRRLFFACSWAGERQEIDLGDINTGDTFTLTYDGQTTGSISFAADMASAIDTALEALSNIEAGDIMVEKESGVHDYVVLLGGSLRDVRHPLITITPTGFTPTGVTRVSLAGSPATGLTFSASDLQISKNGGADANIAGSVTEVGRGRYYYEFTLAELNTRGTVSLVTTRQDIETVFPTCQVTTRVLRSCTAQGGTSESVTLDASASANSDFYLPCIVTPVAGTGAGQGPRFATAYNGVTKVMTVTPAWAVTVDSTTEVEIERSLPMASLDEVREEVGNEVEDRVPSVLTSTGGTILVDETGKVSLARRVTT